jgi:Uncharacterised nucleotidyltransferase
MTTEVTTPHEPEPPDRSVPGCLLRKVAQDAPDSDVHRWPTELVEKLVQVGLGPILYRLAGPVSGSPVAELLLSADLTARLVTENMAAATEEILRAAGPAAAEIVLLKGAAAGQEHYPKPHLRLMGDIDLLATPGIVTRLHTVLGDLGYVQRSHLPPEFFETHHHTMPFFHPKTRLWVELHHALLPAHWSPARQSCFAMDTVLRNTVPMMYHGVPTRRLCDELHLIYTCTHWAGSFSLQRGLVAMIDVIYLLAGRPSLDWGAVIRQMPTDWAARAVGLMLGYLAAHSAIQLNDSMRGFVTDSLRAIGQTNVRLLRWLLDSRMVGRRNERLLTEANVVNVWETLLLRDRSPALNLLQVPFVLLFPPNRADRFHPALAARRMRSLFGGSSE